jgi:hypothetical protein
MILGTQSDTLISGLHLLMRSPFMIDSQMRKLANTKQSLVPATPKSLNSDNLPLLKKGNRSEAVKELQGMLNRLGAKPALPQTGYFGDLTWSAVTRFQSTRGVKPVDGIVGPKTWGAMEREMGKAVVIKHDKPVTDIKGDDFPSKPSFAPLGYDKKIELFGSFEFEHVGDGAIKITDDWAKTNIITVRIPQLDGVEGAGKTGRATIHKTIKDQFVGLWQAWEDEGLLGHVLTWAGAWVPRYMRKVTIPPGGNAKLLSNHAWGTAFDINAAWNGLGKKPAAVGEKGCVRELVATAHKFGFYWGGHFGAGRPDGMHFEAAQIV